MVVNADGRYPSPPNIKDSILNGYGGDSSDEVMGALTGSGPFRWQVQDVTSPSISAEATNEASYAADSANKWYAHYASPNRPRPQFLQFPNGAIDCMSLWSDDSNQPNTTGLVGFESSLNVVTMTGVPSWLQIVAGSAANTVKLIISQPQNTVVETYDKLSTWGDTVTALNKSSRVRGWSLNPSQAAQAIPQIQILTTSFNGTATTVQQTYPTISFFEGPWNEPQGSDPACVALQSVAFKAAVKAGNAAAKVMGPGCVSFNSGTISWLQQHLQALPANFYDAISVHGYNTTNGDMALTDAMLQNFKAMLVKTGYASTPIWMTEAGIFTNVYGVLHWRRVAHWIALWYLMYESYGIPREQQAYFYPLSRGFWDFPSFSQGGGFGTSIPGPMNMMWRGLSERTYNSIYQSRLTFKGAAANLFFGSIYSEPGVSKTVTLINAGMPSGVVQLGITNSTTVTVYDWAGNSKVQSVVNGVVSITTSDLPVYVMTGVNAVISVVDANGGLDKVSQDLVRAPTQLFQEKVNYKDPNGSGTFNLIANNTQEVDYTEGGDSVTAYRSVGPFPQEIKYVWPTTQTVRRAVIMCAPPWQSHSSLTQFSLQTWSGTAWVTQYSYSSTTATTSAWISTDSSWGGFLETYWDEQWIWDVVFKQPVSTTEFRILIQAGSYGGEPNAASLANGMGQGDGTGVTIREISLY